MAEVAPADLVAIPTKKRTRKPLNPKTCSPNESNIVAGAAISQPQIFPENSIDKENSQTLSQHKSSKIKKSTKGKKQTQPDPATFVFEKELKEMQEKLEKMTLEKQQAEELLKLKDQELEAHNKEQEKMKMELKKLQKLKEFKPTMTIPIFQSSKDKDQSKKKKSGQETKKPATPYIMWCKDHWTEVKKENPEAEFSEIANILGAKWKTLTPEEKKPYEEKYQTEKSVYLKIVGTEKRENEAMKLLEEEQKQKTAMELLEQYMQFKQEAEKDGDNKKNKKEKDPLKPKRPESAYFLFMNERRAALIAESKSVVEIAKITGEEWKNMTEKQKARYGKVAKQKNEKYAREMEIYKRTKETEAEIAKKEEDEVLKVLKQEALQLLKKKEKTETIIKKTKEKKSKKKSKKIDDPNKPKRPASSFLLFSKEARKDLSKERLDISNAQLTALVSVKWKELSEEERQRWNREAAEAMEAYKKEMEEYNKKNKVETPNIDDDHH
ncbi:putative chromatin remodeling & transcriptional activation HMG family [Helianthus annuus]|uniref:Chromatin remodeling & transcriptional activation HMG family n=1 Tax=Helianthus annuus TaxID=4232 RepID=A0A251RL09_HELAN|nr:high mobility group B protein 6 [Helianthus annuus]KAF5753517.1 putative chromatin remodeling & transcriptional activation HMG family [Helianthus annuus]KAJ0431409.1 putative chromatin remodeling & transcriptional activation HMG family [Helianthus annuus]KAJ0445874.1 putative chromatin remodeling & transcriptional activation HMG family [Helianthus annuus]KAJ0630840.1 putative chromatin remodeling & transcriptional activation HMG family [Helianthus annuus]KAJ0634699.1 putative chromatin remo